MSLKHQHFWVRLQAQNGQKQIPFFWNSSVYSCSENWRLFHARNWQETDDLVQHSLHRTSQTVSNQKRKSGRPRCSNEQEDKYISVSSLKNRHLTSPQLAASLNSTYKTPVSTSTVKRRLRDAGLLGIVPLSSVCVLLPILIFSFYWPVWDMAFSLQLCLRKPAESPLHCFSQIRNLNNKHCDNSYLAVKLEIILESRRQVRK